MLNNRPIGLLFISFPIKINQLIELQNNVFNLSFAISIV